MTTHSTSGISFPGLLTIVFITLKLCQVIDWSWWWVLCPIWIPVALLGMLLLVVLAVAMLKEFLK